MAKKLAIPEDHREWPDYEFRPFPKWMGRNDLGEDIIVNNENEAETRAVEVVYPMALGYDIKGNVIQSLHPDETSMKRAQVKKPLEPVEPVEPVKLTETKPNGKKEKAT